MLIDSITMVTFVINVLFSTCILCKKVFVVQIKCFFIMECGYIHR